MANITKEQCNEKINEINKVEGFDPSVFKKEYVDTFTNDEEVKFMLPLPYKKAWARMKYPHCVLRHANEDIEITESYAKATVYFYEKNTDPADAYLGSGTGIAYLDSNSYSPEKSKNDMIAKAIGAAESRALYNAGFGLQFYGNVELTNFDDSSKGNIASGSKEVVSNAKANFTLKKTADIGDVVCSVSSPEINGKKIKQLTPDQLVIAFTEAIDVGLQENILNFAKKNRKVQDAFTNANIPI